MLRRYIAQPLASIYCTITSSVGRFFERWEDRLVRSVDEEYEGIDTHEARAIKNSLGEVRKNKERREI